jgi:hypothetical protein
MFSPVYASSSLTNSFKRYNIQMLRFVACSVGSFPYLHGVGTGFRATVIARNPHVLPL